MSGSTSENFARRLVDAAGWIMFTLIEFWIAVFWTEIEPLGVDPPEPIGAISLGVLLSLVYRLLLELMTVLVIASVAFFMMKANAFIISFLSCSATRRHHHAIHASAGLCCDSLFRRLTHGSRHFFYSSLSISISWITVRSCSTIYLWEMFSSDGDNSERKFSTRAIPVPCRNPITIYFSYVKLSFKNLHFEAWLKKI